MQIIPFLQPRPEKVEADSQATTGSQVGCMNQNSHGKE